VILQLIDRECEALTRRPVPGVNVAVGAMPAGIEIRVPCPSLPCRLYSQDDFFFIFTCFFGVSLFLKKNEEAVIIIVHCILDYSCDDDDDFLTTPEFLLWFVIYSMPQEVG